MVTMCITAKRALLPLLVTALLGGNDAAAELPPEPEKCYSYNVTSKNPGKFTGAHCRSEFYFCPEDAETYWGPWENVYGPSIDNPGGPGTVSVSFSYASTTGWFYGSGFGGSL